ncbi:MAG: hypothetical protein AAF206_15610 [Bacteroidota bacterium]
MLKRVFFSLVFFQLMCLVSLTAQDRFYEEEVIEIVRLQDTAVQKVIRAPQLFTEKWDTLSQIRFWRRVIRTQPELSFLSIATNRRVLHTFPTQYYDTLGRNYQRAFKDSMRASHGLPGNTPLYVTYGKGDYYNIRAVLPEIGQAIDIFRREGTPPLYAQAILLIESPGRLRSSPTGAYGPFQLMRSVGRDMGLTINSSVDERADFDKSARASARFLRRVCIPETRRILKARGMTFSEDEIWFRLLVLHVYHAGAGNVSGALRQIPKRYEGMDLIRKLWRTKYRGFGNASQNYTQVALASLLELEWHIARDCSVLCE